ncbi:MAG TPA: hypothetical protein VGE10_01760 [Zeimonas sp.]
MKAADALDVAKLVGLVAVVGIGAYAGWKLYKGAGAAAEAVTGAFKWVGDTAADFADSLPKGTDVAAAFTDATPAVLSDNWLSQAQAPNSVPLWAYDWFGLQGDPQQGDTFSQAFGPGNKTDFSDNWQSHAEAPGSVSLWKYFGL